MAPMTWSAFTRTIQQTEQQERIPSKPADSQGVRRAETASMQPETRRLQCHSILLASSQRG